MIDRASIGSTSGYSLAEPRWRLAGSYEVRKGFDILNASDSGTNNLSRQGADTTAGLVRFSGLAEYRPGRSFALVLSPRAQYTSSALTSFEQYSGGNYTVGRGYDPGTIIGDRGIGFQAEVRVGSMQPQSQDSLAFQPYVFLDQAWVWQRGVNRNGALGNRYNQELTSAGIGVRAAYGAHGRVDLTLAKPLRRAGLTNNPGLPPRNGDVRLLMSLTTKLVPW
jgi:hemolysin activation/secretion protein